MEEGTCAVRHQTSERDTVSKARGLPVAMFFCGWTSVIENFKEKFGVSAADLDVADMLDDVLLAQSFFRGIRGKADRRHYAHQNLGTSSQFWPK